MKLKNKKILFIHFNNSEFIKKWHIKRNNIAESLGYKIDTICISDYLPYMNYQKLSLKMFLRDKSLLKFYEFLIKTSKNYHCLIHFGGIGIHPDILKNLNLLKIYHCADDPDASFQISKPVAKYYDIHAISNPTCINLYKSWGCQNVFFWPLGSLYYDEDINTKQIANKSFSERANDLVFIGSKKGVINYNLISRIAYIKEFFYTKVNFFDFIEEKFPNILAYGNSWKNGFIEDKYIPNIYLNSLIGINKHNSTGPINFRFYDLAAFGVCQVCDNKSNLNEFFTLDKEIVGFDSKDECYDKINFLIKNKDIALKIGINGHLKYLKEFNHIKIWKDFFKNISMYI